MQRNFLIITVIFLFLEFYVYQAFKNLMPRNIYRYIYIGLTVALYATILYLATGFNRAERDQVKIHVLISLFLVLILPKILIVLFLLIDDIIRILQWTFSFLDKDADNHYPDRRKLLSLLGVGSFALMSGMFLDGIVFGKYRHRARKVKVKIAGLPAAFKGFRIVQISDAHCGSFANPEKLAGAFDLINEQKPDVVLFTGDMVNNFAEEFEPFLPLFSKLNAPSGKFSVLGNHDYGHYANWHSEEAAKQNVPKLIALQEAAGFEVLRNEHRKITRGDSSIYILGVENWGIKPFPQYGDLGKAIAGVPSEAVKVLMSHDPSHFDAIVKHHPANVQLTVSGHTHGMQFGLDLKNYRWSPVQYRYQKWADLYESAGKYLYVNRGFGVLAYPGRVGIHPEITVIELS